MYLFVWLLGGFHFRTAKDGFWKDLKEYIEKPRVGKMTCNPRKITLKVLKVEGRGLASASLEHDPFKEWALKVVSFQMSIVG